MQGVEYESRSINIRPEMKAMYNEACDVWYLVRNTVHGSLCVLACCWSFLATGC